MNNLKPKIASTVLLLLTAEFWLLLLERSDSPPDFIPFMHGRGFGVSAYDVFLILGIFGVRLLASHLHVTGQDLRNVCRQCSPENPRETAAMIGAAVVGHMLLAPPMARFFREPLGAVLHGPDGLRRAILVALPLTAIVIIGWLSKTRLFSPASPANLPGRLPPPPTNRWI